LVYNASGKIWLLNLIALAISSINFIIPSATLNKCLCKVNEEIENKVPYDDARLNFPTEYDRANPVT